MATAVVNQTRSDAFAEKMLGMLNGAGVGLMASIGHRTGLFDAMAHMAPSTSQQIADKVALQERYVREWLGAMVTGGVVEYDAALNTYQLPAEHAAVLTRGAGPNNIASTMQWLAVLGSVEDKIVERFKTGGGVAYCCYSRFHEVMAEESSQTVLAALVDSILPLVPGILERLEQGIDVLDIGCGRGRAMNFLAEAFPNSRFAGYDLGDDAIAAAREEASERGLANARFESRDATMLGEAARYDLVTAFDAIHDQAHPARVLDGVFAALRPGGTLLMQDIAASSFVERNIGQPLAPFIYTISCMHCMTVSLAQDGVGLGAAWGEELAQQMLATAGFRGLTVHRLPHDILNNYYIARKP